jgi:hypothetical protein
MFFRVWISYFARSIAPKEPNISGIRVANPSVARKQSPTCKMHRLKYSVRAFNPVPRVKGEFLFKASFSFGQRGHTNARAVISNATATIPQVRDSF